jgi:hypothetical protein
MTQRPWTDLVAESATRHLVVARLEPKAAEEPAALLLGLIEGLAPTGDFALLTRCEEDGAAVLCAFSNEADSKALAAAVEAVEIDQYPEWASRRGFVLDKSTAQAIADAIEASAGAAEPPQPLAAPELLSVHP